MAEDTPGWSEKGKRTDSGEAGEKKTPTRPSKRAAEASTGDAESTVVRTPATSDTGAKKVAKAAATAGQRDVSFSSRMGFPALIALICLLGIVAVVYARSTREALAEPVQNLDHWHAVYGVYNCDTGEYLPPFQSTQDDTGIHSHGDGVMHIHPFFEISSGNNAQMRHWMSEMNVEMTPEAINVNNVFDPSVNLIAGEQCGDGSGTAEIKLLHWDFDFQALAEDRPDPQVITADFGEVKFDTDREVYVFAYVSEDTDLADIPIPPMERFDTLNNVSAAIEWSPDALVPRDSGVELDGDGDVQVEVEGEPAEE